MGGDSGGLLLQASMEKMRAMNRTIIRERLFINPTDVTPMKRMVSKLT